ncbi:hypothetical protein HI146_RS26025 [Escherichia coli]|nr:hypothetical protein [Escherichia coli]
MSLDTTRATDLFTRLNDEEYLAEIKYKLEKLARSAEVIEVKGHLPMDQFHTFKEDMVYYPNEIWIEWEHWTNKTLRIEGYCVKYESEPGDVTKTLSIWCTKTHELVEVNLIYMKGFRWGDIQ